MKRKKKNPTSSAPRALDDIVPKTPGTASPKDIALGDILETAKAAREKEIERAFRAPDSAIVITDLSKQALLREREVLSRALMEEKRELALESFWYFFTEVLFPEVWKQHYTEAFHKPIADILQNLPPGSNQMFILPREHRKSTMCNLGFSLWQIVRNPNIRIMLIGAKEKTVKKWSILIRSAFLSGSPGFSEFQKVFYDFVFQQTRKTPLQALEWSVENRSAAVADATFFATYLGVAGAGARANLQIFDDPYERRNVSNPIQSMKALEQTMDLFPLIEVNEAAPLRQRIFLATRWAYHDPTGVLIGDRKDGSEEVDENNLPPFRAMVRHSFEDRGRPCELCPEWVTRLYPHGHPDVEKGDPILYPILTRDGLMQRLAEYTVNPEKGESLWYHQYQNICLAPKDQKFQAEWFIQAHFPLFQAPRLRVLAIDSADKDFQKLGVGDYMVALFGEFDDWGRLLLVHGLRSRSWTREEFIRKVIVWCKATNWWPSKVAKEKFGNDTFLTDIKREFMSQERIVHCVPVSRPTTVETGSYMKKLDWIIESLQAPMERGEVIFGRQFPSELLDRARQEGTNLGQLSHDDVIDTLALLMVKGIRVEAPQRVGPAAAPPAPPDLSLFDIEQRAAAPRQLTPVEEAFYGSGVAGAGLDLVENRVAPPDLGIRLDLGG